MKIIFSRHAKRRAKLYEIPESKVIDILTNMKLHQGEHEIIKDMGLKYPVKIVASVGKDSTLVITNYPLKKGRKK